MIKCYNRNRLCYGQPAANASRHSISGRSISFSGKIQRPLQLISIFNFSSFPASFHAKHQIFRLPFLFPAHIYCKCCSLTLHLLYKNFVLSFFSIYLLSDLLYCGQVITFANGILSSPKHPLYQNCLLFSKVCVICFQMLFQAPAIRFS